MEPSFASIATNFATGGFVVASVSVLATYMNPVAGAIWWSFPFSILPSIYFMRAHGRSNQDVGAFVRSITFALVLLVVAAYALSYYFNKLPAYADDWWIAVAKGAAIWLFCAIVFYLVYTRFLAERSR